MGKTGIPVPKTRHGPARVLLIIDGEATVRRAFARVLKLDFDEVHTASGPNEASSVLEKQSVTHLVCGRSFGPDIPLGMDLIPKWRKTYPNINRALILTRGDIPSLATVPQVDCILPKPVAPESLLRALHL
jgi:DNA-binding NtrC family response regulator